jgi:hypothetical protein
MGPQESNWKETFGWPVKQYFLCSAEFSGLLRRMGRCYGSIQGITSHASAPDEVLDENRKAG